MHERCLYRRSKYNKMFPTMVKHAHTDDANKFNHYGEKEILKPPSNCRRLLVNRECQVFLLRGFSKSAPAPLHEQFLLISPLPALYHLGGFLLLYVLDKCIKWGGFISGVAFKSPLRQEMSSMADLGQNAHTKITFYHCSIAGVKNWSMDSV